MFHKVLIANRGEIARRIGAVARRLGMATVAVYSEADAELPFVREADESVCVGPAPARDSYLRIEAILEAAARTGAEAVHPGYGFLSENADFARAVGAAGLVFVGPPPATLAAMRDKSAVRAAVAAAGVPVVPGSAGLVADAGAAAAEAERIGYPVLCKAAGGGGGIGMTVAESPAALEKAFRTTVERARAAFGREGVYLERYFPRPRHLEVQVLGDAHGHLLHMLERECSIQRRHQKLVEEGGSPLFAGGVQPALRERLLAEGLRAAAALGYSNAGTAEFLCADGEVYFIELNARLQVEHPVTELTTGVDLIGWQFRIAAGERLDLRQEDVRRTGHAIELRVCAEDPVRFFPSPGRITRWREPQAMGVRVDAGYAEGNTVTPHYDSLLAKLVVVGGDRPEALRRAADAVEAFEIDGPKSNLALHRRILASEAFASGALHTHFVDELAPPSGARPAG